MVGRHGVTDHHEHSGVLDRSDHVGLRREFGEERRMLDVRARILPVVFLSFADRNAIPFFIAGKDVRILLFEHLGRDDLLDGLADLLL